MAHWALNGLAKRIRDSLCRICLLFNMQWVYLSGLTLLHLCRLLAYMSSFLQACGIQRQRTVSWIEASEGEALQNVQWQRSDHRKTHPSWRWLGIGQDKRHAGMKSNFYSSNWSMIKVVWLTGSRKKVFSVLTSLKHVQNKRSVHLKPLPQRITQDYGNRFVFVKTSQTEI